MEQAWGWGEGLEVNLHSRAVPCTPVLGRLRAWQPGTTSSPSCRASWYALLDGEASRHPDGQLINLWPSIRGGVGSTLPSPTPDTGQGYRACCRRTAGAARRPRHQLRRSSSTSRCCCHPSMRRGARHRTGVGSMGPASGRPLPCCSTRPWVRVQLQGVRAGARGWGEAGAEKEAQEAKPKRGRDRHAPAQVLCPNFGPNFISAPAPAGVGMLAVPRAFSLLGIVAGTSGLLAVAALLLLSLHSLLTAGAGIMGGPGPPLTYGAAIRAVLGGWGSALADAGVAATSFGLMVVQLLVISDILGGGRLRRGWALAQRIARPCVTDWPAERDACPRGLGTLGRPAPGLLPSPWCPCMQWAMAALDCCRGGRMSGLWC